MFITYLWRFMTIHSQLVLVHVLITISSQFVHQLLMTCSWVAPNLFTACSQHVLNFFMNCWRLIHDFLKTCSHFIHKLFMTTSILVYGEPPYYNRLIVSVISTCRFFQNLYLTNSWLNFFMACLLLAHDFVVSTCS